MRKNKLDQEYWNESTHTVLSHWFVVIAVGIEIFLGIKYINELIGQLCMLEAVFGLSGLLLLDPFHGKDFTLYPKKFKPIHKNTFYRFVITFSVIVVIQFIFQIIPLVTSTDMALGIVFAAVCEEYFFRGVLLEPAFKSGFKVKDKITVWTYGSVKKKPKKQISLIEIGAIILGAVVFASMHVNYYGDDRLLLMVFVGGLWLGAIYWWNKDLTAVILAHFLLNIVFVYQFYMIYGLG